MRMSFQIALALLIGLGSLYPGVLCFLAPAGLIDKYFAVDITTLDTTLRLAVETQIRLLAAMWIAAGTAILLVVRHFEKHTAVIRLVLAGLALSALGEMLAARAVVGSLHQEQIPNVITIVICAVMEGWRMRLVRKTVPI